ncbi:myo-inositol-1(or 4)-monophosphatase [Kribbella amoyensis]|uniref:Myo-inositol-1(Or 4)-monophosphatase n=1 Tax=Kribbella amoyensis TaxID=996641 RepID=A0A561BME7_9ACTN|nr:inositol monophosphatase family protein [Kribbella amoyensis]TWD80018.1 myo-inositol-1(or 4)-monophosphatase [Kribbella amoyensis]
MTLTDAEVALKAAKAGARVVAGAYGRETTRYAKSSTDFATQTDLDGEKAIVAVLSAHRPDDAREGEEFGRSGPASTARRWLIDPLCGTLNFAATTPLMVVNVALLDDDRTVAAASADPMADEIFWTDGGSAWVRRGDTDDPLVPTPATGLVEINVDRPSGSRSVSAQLVADVAFRSQYSPRVLSSTLGVAWVAAGRRAAYVSDGTFRNDLHFAAGLAITEAAGCVVTNLSGGPLHAGDGLVVSASEQVQADLLEHLERLR